MDDKIRKKVQLAQLNMLKQVKNICDKYGINYILLGGTLIGAIRHKGFIPWDDDLDIGMLREDYEYFLEIAQEELDNEYFLQTKESDKMYGYGFAKMLKKGTIYKENTTKKAKIQEGIYIDIFPFENAPNNLKIRRRQAKKRFLYRRLVLLKSGYTLWGKGDLKKMLAYKMLKFFLLFVRREYLIKKNDHYMKIGNLKGIKTEEVVNINGTYAYEKELVKREYFIELIEVPFEDSLFKVPKAYDEFLSHVYGDYMKLPPKEKQVGGHDVIEIKV